MDKNIIVNNSFANKRGSVITVENPTPRVRQFLAILADKADTSETRMTVHTHDELITEHLTRIFNLLEN